MHGAACPWTLEICNRDGSGIRWECVCAGDPSRSDVAPEEMTWTVRCDENFTVCAAPLSQRPQSFGYVVRESDRRVSDHVACFFFAGFELACIE